MKKPIPQLLLNFTLGLILVSLPYDGQAQNNSQENNEYPQKSTETQSRLIAEANRYYLGGVPHPTEDSIRYYHSGNQRHDETIHIIYEIAHSIPWLQINGEYYKDPADSSHYFEADGTSFNNFNKKRIFSNDAEGRISITHEYTRTNSSSPWENNIRREYTYLGSNENPSSEVEYIWDGVSWKNSIRVFYTYDPNSGQQVKLTYEHWDDVLETWSNSRQYLSTYDSDGYETSYTSQIWSSTWVNKNKSTSEFDANKNRIKHQSFDWNTTLLDWELKTRESYTYNSMHLLTEAVTEQLNTSTSTMENEEKEVFDYDSNGTLLSYIKQDWGTSSWINYLKKLYSFDTDGMLVEMITQEWSSANSGSWANSKKTILDYNTFNQIEEGNLYDWQTDSTWEKSWRANYYYETFENTEAGLIDHELNTTIIVFPNPTNQQLNLQVNEGHIEEVRIYSINGRLVFKNTYNSNGSEIIIPTDQFKQGTYLLKGRTQNTSFSKQFIVQH